MDVGDRYLLHFDAEDSGVQSVLTNIINQARSGITVGIAMDADTTKVVQKIEQISNLMEQKIGKGVFDFNDLFNFKNAVAELGTLASKFDQLAPIFNSYNNMANNLTESMTKIASLKLDASQFNALKVSLENINTSLNNIGEKLGVVSSESGMKQVAQDAKEAAAEIDKAANATEKLGKEQKELGATNTAPVKSTTGTDGVNQQNAFGATEDSLRTMIDLFQKIEANLSAMKSVLVDVGDGQEFSPLLSMIDKIDASIKELNASMAGMKLNLNMNVGSEVNERVAQKTAQAMNRQVEAYRKLFAAMKSSGKTNKDMIFFSEPENASMAEIIGAYKNVISKAEKQFGKDTFKNVIGSKYTDYIREVQNATDQFNRATKAKQIENPLGDLFGKTDLTEVISQLGTIASKLDEISQAVVKFQDTFRKGLDISPQLEEINKLSDRVRELEGEFTKVRPGGIATGANGEQLALEKTLHATYKIQQNMVKILSEINSKMVSGANTATASYEQLKTVMTETVDAAKTIGTEENKQVAKGKKSQLNEQYTIMIKNLREILRLKQRLPKADENEAASIKQQIDSLTVMANQQQAILNSSNAINAVRQNEADILKRQIEIQNSLNVDLAKAAELEAKRAAAKKLESDYNTTGKFLRSVGNGQLLATEESEKVQKLISQFKEYDALLASVGNDFEKLENKKQAEIKESLELFNKLTQAQKEAFKAGAYNAYNKGGTYKGQLTDLSADNSLAGLQSQVNANAITKQAALEQVAASIVRTTTATQNARLEDIRYNEATGELIAKFKDKQKNLKQIAVSFQDVGNATRHSIKPLEEYQGIFSKMFSSMGKKMKELLRYFSSFMIIMRVINAVKQGIQTVREMNTALTEMKLVTESTTAEMAKAEKQIQKVAATVASTNVDIAKSATDWAKLGLIK